MIFYRKDGAFTLIEILIVIIIIGILAAITLPNYEKTKERALDKEAISNLKLIAAAEKIYRMETGAYYPGNNLSDSDFSTINSNLKLSLTEANWDYQIGVRLNEFTATADRQGTGGSLDCQYTLTSTDSDGEPNPNSSCP